MATDFARTDDAHSEGQVAKMIEDQTAKLPSDAFLWLAVGSMAVSATLQMTGNKHGSLFVGQWAPPAGETARARSDGFKIFFDPRPPPPIIPINCSAVLHQAPQRCRITRRVASHIVVEIRVHVAPSVSAVVQPPSPAA